MSAKQAFGLVIGLVLLFLVEGVIKHFLSGFPIELVLAAQGGPVITILLTKLKNDIEEIRASKANGNSK